MLLHVGLNQLAQRSGLGPRHVVHALALLEQDEGGQSLDIVLCTNPTQQNQHAIERYVMPRTGSLGNAGPIDWQLAHAQVLRSVHQRPLARKHS